ncbi:MAG: hypothetical protein EOM91_17965 [Sphingobacteriia bacterium]|nr:hypothetical protein [Sphingobacteriia bacterium]
MAKPMNRSRASIIPNTTGLSVLTVNGGEIIELPVLAWRVCYEPGDPFAGLNDSEEWEEEEEEKERTSVLPVSVAPVPDLFAVYDPHARVGWFGGRRSDRESLLLHLKNAYRRALQTEPT